MPIEAEKDVTRCRQISKTGYDVGKVLMPTILSLLQGFTLDQGIDPWASRTCAENLG